LFFIKNATISGTTLMPVVSKALSTAPEASGAVTALATGCAALATADIGLSSIASSRATSARYCSAEVVIWGSFYNVYLYWKWVLQGQKNSAQKNLGKYLGFLG
jgi:hypothetical protein